MAGKHIQSRTAEEREPRAAVRRKKRLGGKKTALIILGCVALIALAVTVLWKALVAPPDVSHNLHPGGSVPVTETENGDEPTTAGGRKDGYYTFLLLGKDTSSGSTDTIILVSYDVPNQQVNMMSIPRDTAVNVPWSIKKINSVYSAKESSGGGLENLKQQVAYLTGVMPDFYVIIEWEAVGELVEALGGVEFDVPRNMNYDDPYQNLHIHLEKGVQVLNGEEAMGVIRYRHDNVRADGVMPGYADGDLGRTKTQPGIFEGLCQAGAEAGERGQGQGVCPDLHGACGDGPASAEYDLVCYPSHGDGCGHHPVLHHAQYAGELPRRELCAAQRGGDR